jgi:purine nucleosidase
MAEVPGMMPCKLILDTDPGIDDALALAMLSGLPDLELLAITTIFGNADVRTTTRNALFLRRQLGLRAPVYQGASDPLVRPRGPGAPHVHGDNGLGGVPLPALGVLTPDQGEAATRIAELVRAYPHQVTLLAIGPLTNLALALDCDPAIAGLVRGVVVMGGAFGTDGRWGNVTPAAEANIHNDPEAAAAVLSAPWPVTLVGLDVTTRCVLTTAQSARMGDGGGSGRLMRDLSHFYAAAYARYDGLDGCCLHDVAALALLVAPDLFGLAPGWVRITLNAEETGRTRLEPDADGRHRVCLTVDADRLVELFLDSVTVQPVQVGTG